MTVSALDDIAPERISLGLGTALPLRLGQMAIPYAPAEAPGRVGTLIREQDAICAGMAYLISPQVFDQLDIREKNGYLRFATELCLDDGSCAEGLVYIATEENAAFLGPAPEHEIARHIAASAGPSGPNRDYLTQLAAALRELEAHDPHVYEIEQHLAELIARETGKS